MAVKVKRIPARERKLGDTLITEFMGVKHHQESKNPHYRRGYKEWFTGLPATYANDGRGDSYWGDVSYQRRREFQYKHLRYDIDWNWLMPVIDEIDAIKDVHFSYDVHKSSGTNQFKVKVFGIKPDGEYPLYAFVDVTDEDKLTAHYKAVVSFLFFKLQMDNKEKFQEILN